MTDSMNFSSKAVNIPEAGIAQVDLWHEGSEISIDQNPSANDII